MALPIENLDNKTFNDFFSEAVSRIPQYAPGWTDHNTSDPGIMFIELFSWLSDMQIYSLNRIKEKDRKKFLKLLGIVYPSSPVPAKSFVTFSFNPLSSGRFTLIQEGTLLYAKDDMTKRKIPFETSQDFTVLNTKIEYILSYKDSSNEFTNNKEANENSHIFYYAFGDKPGPQDAFYIGLNGDTPHQSVSLGIFIMNESNKVQNDLIGYWKPELYPPADLKWEFFDGVNWESLPVITDSTLSLTETGVLSFEFSPSWVKGAPFEATLPEALWLRCRFLEGGYPVPPRIDKILINTTPVFQLQSFRKYYQSTGLPGQIIETGEYPLLNSSHIENIYDELDGLKTPCVLIEENETLNEWESVEDFDSSKMEDSHYVLDIINGTLQFGDGIKGKIPPETSQSKKTSIIVEGKSCQGERGNVAAFSINEIPGELKKDIEVYNYLSASGGKNVLTLTDAMLEAKNDLKLRYRAVTAEDYENIVLGTPELKTSRVKVVPEYHPYRPTPVEGVISIIVVPESTDITITPGKGFYNTIYAHLDKYRLLTTEIFIIPPVYIEIGVSATITVKDESLSESTIKRVKKKLKKYLHPINGGKDETGWDFGRNVYKSHIYRIIDEVEGVDYVEDIILYKNGEAVERDVSIPVHGLATSGDNIYIIEKSQSPGEVEV